MLDKPKNTILIVRLSIEDQTSFLEIQLHILGVFLEFFQELEPGRIQASTKARLGRSQALVKAKHGEQCSWRSGKINLRNRLWVINGVCKFIL